MGLTGRCPSAWWGPVGLFGVEADIEPGDSVGVADAVRYASWDDDQVAGSHESFRPSADGGTPLTLDWLATFIDDLPPSYQGA